MIIYSLGHFFSSYKFSFIITSILFLIHSSQFCICWIYILPEYLSSSLWIFVLSCSIEFRECSCLFSTLIFPFLAVYFCSFLLLMLLLFLLCNFIFLIIFLHVITIILSLITWLAHYLSKSIALSFILPLYPTVYIPILS